jgi:peptide chain release factor 1
MSDFKNAINKLSKIKERYDEISDKLSLPETVNNQKLYKELSKELSHIEEIVDEYKKYCLIEKQINDSEEMLKTETDPELKILAEEELEKLNAELLEKQNILKKLLIPPVENADKNIIVEIRAGTGGDEAALFCGDLFRMYNKFAEKKNWKVEVISANDTGLGGYKEIIFSITGKNVYDNLRFEYGGHRVQRIPVTESSGRIHTSAVTVAVLPEAEESDVEIRNEDLRIDVFRASGAGGQHVNKTESAVRITHIPTGFVVQCQDNRSQHQNKASAMKVLRSRLYEYQRNIAERERSQMRKEQVGSGDRSQKIRTYNYPQNRVTDHRINLTLYKLDLFMEGDIDEMIEALKINDAEERMKLS